MQIVLSPSSLKKFKTCPYQFHAMYVTKELPYTQSEAAARGEKLHAVLENAIKSRAVGLPWPEVATRDTAEKFYRAVQKLEAAGWDLHVEQAIAISRFGVIRGWFDKAPDNFMRCKIDLYATHPNKDFVIVIDWKTGKQYGLDSIQLAVNALCLQSVTNKSRYLAMFAYLDSGEVQDHSYEIPNCMFDEYPLQDYVDASLMEVHTLVTDIENCEEKNMWPKTRNRFCRWCAVDTCMYRG